MLAGLLYAGSGLGLSIVLATRALVAGPGTAMALPRRTEWVWLAAAILFGGVLGPVALMYGLTITSASTASLLLNLEGVFTALLAWFLFRENFDSRIAIGMFAIVAGGTVLAWSPGEGGGSSKGVLFIALACLSWALDNNLTRRISTSDAVLIAGIKGLVAGSVNLALAVAMGLKLPSVALALASALVGFLGYGVSLVLFVLVLRQLGTARAGAYFSVAPFFGAAVALLLQQDQATWQLGIAGMLMAVGVWLHVTERHGHEHAHEFLEHAHAHTHDAHHQHTHESWDGREPHTHSHVHAPMVHDHPHYPDAHHRHPH
jgi:drug/metabolite transporter (DMT)-like permease